MKVPNSWLVSGPGCQIEFEIESIPGTTDTASDRKHRYQAPRAKVLTETDASRYSIFDVVMPLPGKDVAFPGGSLGELYREFLVKDGLDPDNFDRKQKSVSREMLSSTRSNRGHREYLLGGSYRKVLHLPRELSWELYRYTDPELPLAQADEDMLLGYKPVAEETDGKFRALQIRLTLGTAAYATMALREVLKTDTSSQHQSSLTQAAEDQQYKGSEKVT
jgi:tRNA pseudouridine13 synthase